MDELKTEREWRKEYRAKMESMLGFIPAGELFGWRWFVDGVRTGRDTFDRMAEAGEGSKGVIDMDYLLCIGAVTFEAKPYTGLPKFHDEMLQKVAKATAVPEKMLYPRVTPLRNDVPRTKPGSSYRNPRSVNWEDWPTDANRNCRCVVLEPVAVGTTTVATNTANSKPPESFTDPRPMCDCRKPAPVDGQLQDSCGRFYECAGCRGRVPYLKVVSDKLALRPAGKAGKPVFDPAPPGLGALK